MIPSLLKSHSLDVTFWERSVKRIERGIEPLVTLALKSATGRTAGRTFISKVLESIFVSFLTVKLTVYFPYFTVSMYRYSFLLKYIPSPKLHFHEVGEPILLSVKATFSGASPEMEDAEKLAIRDFGVKVHI